MPCTSVLGLFIVKTLVPGVVTYKNEYYLLYAVNSVNKAKLIKPDGLKYSGTPNLDKLTLVKERPMVTFNGHQYIYTKQGIFSCSTGNHISSFDIFVKFVQSKHPLLLELDSRVKRSGYRFTYKGHLSDEWATLAQARKGYYPQGYGFHSYEYECGITSWECYSSCD
jgi:hypothetical protein